MKSAWYQSQGQADQVLHIGEEPMPDLKPNEVLVRIYVSGINPSDVKRRLGSREAMEFPKIIPHSDGAGIIEAVGSNVINKKVGQRVWIYNAQWQRPYGTAAQYAALPQDLVIALPDNTDFTIGACLGVPAFTAHRAVFANGAVENKVVLVTGGAGSVGNFAIQMAKWGGATVITTVSCDEKAKLAKKAGADFVINYKTKDAIKNILAASPDGVDHIVDVDFGGNLAQSEAVLKTNGSISSYASMGDPNPIISFYKLFIKNPVLYFIYIYNLADNDRLMAINDINKMLEEQSLTTIIGARFTLDEIVSAHKLVEAGTTIGNIIIDRI